MRPCVHAFLIASLIASLVAAAPSLALESRAPGADSALAQVFGRDLTRLDEVFPGLLKRVSDDRQVLAVLNGLLREIDPSGVTRVYPKEKASAVASTAPAFSVRLVEGVPTVTFVAVHSDAFLRDVREGDIIMRVDEHLVLGRDPAAINAALRGAPGSTVKIGLFRRNTSSYKDIAVKREAFASHAFVRSVSPSLVFVQLGLIDDASLTELETKLAALKTQKVTGIVIDLRDACGGGVDDAARLVAAFLSGESKPVGKLVGPQGTRTVTATPKTPGLKVPLVVLVGHGTCDAAEIAAAALLDDKRAVLLGERTLGLGLAPTTIDFNADLSLDITAGFITSPAGQDLVGQGVKPDVETHDEAVPEAQVARYHEEFAAFCKGVKPEAESAKKTGTTTAEAAATGEEEEEESGASPEKPKETEGPLDQYPLVKHYDGSLGRAIGLLVSWPILYDQVQSNN